MNQGKCVFTQVSSFLPQRFFDCVKYQGNYTVRHFSCLNQLMCMIFGLLVSRESISDWILAINAHPGKLYHLGFGKGILKETLSRRMKKDNG